LKREYLTWQAELYESMKRSDPGASRYNQSNTGSSPPIPSSHNGPEKARDQPPHLSHTEERSEQRKPASTLHDNQTFPRGCLLFIKNLHPQTNKTTLKKLFEGALESESSPRSNGRGLDYVDWSKGMSSVSLCFLAPANRFEPSLTCTVPSTTVGPLLRTLPDEIFHHSFNNTDGRERCRGTVVFSSSDFISCR